ncbi:hypothetical protein MF672_009055 [Actinomadura sp. ATCC 31491]|uniref:DUF4232 domain-containing protein n=1 Tax=Actinomadura luzonensis TaxID=2805427 RepID=A0ABT0FNS2_9ACTN|nr:hypothetical protein [Actinomadura luzonensis]MCK2213936.1 hypothetical protein [Actinomadura luzonensis]
MDPETMRGDGGDVYWRRRMSVLVAVLVVVAVVAWACSSGGEGGPEQSSEAKASPSATPAVDPLLAGLRTLAMGTASPSPTPTSSGRPTPATSRYKRPGAPCAEEDLVLSLQGGKDQIYAADVRPSFIVTLVNTGPVMCRADVGPRAMEIRITSGQDRIWSTADCVSGVANDVAELQRGVPYVRSLSWDRRRSSADCRSTPPAALPGTYVATARFGRLRSTKGVFHLR